MVGSWGAAVGLEQSTARHSLEEAWTAGTVEAGRGGGWPG